MKLGKASFDIFSKDKLSFIGIAMLIIFVLVAVLAPVLAPYDPDEMHRDSNGEIKRLESPSREHPLGTTNYGRDVYSQLIMGTRIALLVGALAAFFCNNYRNSYWIICRILRWMD